MHMEYTVKLIATELVNKHKGGQEKKIVLLHQADEMVHIQWSLREALGNVK